MSYINTLYYFKNVDDTYNRKIPLIQIKDEGEVLSKMSLGLQQSEDSDCFKMLEDTLLNNSYFYNKSNNVFEFSILNEYFRIVNNDKEMNTVTRKKENDKRSIVARMLSISKEEINEDGLDEYIKNVFYGTKSKFSFKKNEYNIYTSKNIDMNIFVDGENGFCLYYGKQKGKKNDKDFFPIWFDRIKILYMFALCYKLKLEDFFNTLYSKYNTWFSCIENYKNSQAEIRDFLKEFYDFEMIYFDNIVSFSNSQGEGLAIYDFFAKNLNIHKLHSDIKTKITFITSEINSYLMFIESNNLAEKLSNKANRFSFLALFVALSSVLLNIWENEIKEILDLKSCISFVIVVVIVLFALYYKIIDKDK